jgi:alginate O-acetyltransferase complex protein AlgI
VAFCSAPFVLFLIVVLAILSLPLATTSKQIVVIAASFVFYATYDWRLPLLLAAVSIVSAIAARIIAQQQDLGRRRLALVVSIALYVGILAYFKYREFLLGVFRLAAPAPVASSPSMVLVPIGLSFYIFKVISYAVDVYRGNIEPLGVRQYILYLVYFPELIAGPIARATEFSHQMARPLGPTLTRVQSAAGLILVGVTKKMLIADRCALIADPIFDSSVSFAAGTLWLGVVAYAIQIYCDFSGYTDIAIGVSKLIGYDVPENFNMPYLSDSIADFWRRWHITLGSWLRDYLYIPLGGNRGGALGASRNLICTMAIAGLWHGASWNFVIWGCGHGLALAANRLWRQKFGVPSLVGTVVTFMFVIWMWVPFRARTFAGAMTMWTGMLGMGAGGVLWLPSMLAPCVALVVLGHWAGVSLSRGNADDFTGKILLSAGLVMERNPVSGDYVGIRLRTALVFYLVIVWVMVLFLLSPAGGNPFIYGKF